MNYIINKTDTSIDLHLENEFAAAYTSILLNAAQQGVFNDPNNANGDRMKRFVENVGLKLGLVQLAPEMEARPDPPINQGFTQTVFVNGQPVNMGGPMDMGGNNT